MRQGKLASCRLILIDCFLLILNRKEKKHWNDEDNPAIFSVSQSKYLFYKHNRNIDTCMSTHPCEYIHAYPTPMSTSERLSRFDLKIHEVGHQKCSAVDGDVASH
jgi:hypothetical protein